MKSTVLGTTKTSYKASKEELDSFSGKAAGVCYLASTFSELIDEEPEKTNRRISQTKSSGHHSVYDHTFINLYLESIPKVLAMLLNNEKMYTTSEKSARYTKMVLNVEEQKLYDKWLKIFIDRIKNEYQEKFPEFFNDKKIEKLAQENARYLISIFTPTSMVYTVSYRQYNLLYAFMQKEIKEPSNPIFEKLKKEMQDFCKDMEQSGYIDEHLSMNEKHRAFSLFNSYAPVSYYGDVYCTSYLGSFAQLAQAQRHRTISYTISLTDAPSFYVPKIIRDDKDLTNMWLKDMSSQKENFPQGMLIEIHEFGTLENFELKMLERKCTFAQLEIDNQTNQTLNEYVGALKDSNHPRFEELNQYTKGSRCTFPNYKCLTPCGFNEGVLGIRKI